MTSLVVFGLVVVDGLSGLEGGVSVTAAGFFTLSILRMGVVVVVASGSLLLATGGIYLAVIESNASYG